MILGTIIIAILVTLINISCYNIDYKFENNTNLLYAQSTQDQDGKQIGFLNVPEADLH
jgi:hypothetical protein